MYERIVKTMYPENQDFIRTLKDWKGTDKATFHPGGVFATNMFEVTDLPGYDEFGYSGLARDISRVNHRYVQRWNALRAFLTPTHLYCIAAVRMHTSRSTSRPSRSPDAPCCLS